jgi:hypothetical protein
MAEPEELLDKADALMARHRKPRTPADPAAGIPVLTDVVNALHGNDGRSGVVSGDGGLPVLTESVPHEQIEDVSTQDLRARIHAALLTELQPEIDMQVEERLKYTLEPLVEKMFSDLRGDLQAISREILTDAIRTAVERELDRHKARG